MPKKKTHDEFVAELNEKYPNEYILLEPYIDSQHKIKVIHIPCETEWDLIPTSLLRGRCKKCSDDKKRKTHDQFVEELYERYGDEYKVVSEYIGSHKPIKVYHEKCAREYDIKPYLLLGGCQCKKCYDESRKKSHEQFVKEVKEVLGSDYEVIGKYVNSNTKIIMYHKKCEQEYPAIPRSILFQKAGCIHCLNENRKKTHEQFLCELENKYPSKFKILGIYSGADETIEIRCVDCGYEWEPLARHILSYGKCPSQVCRKDRKTHEEFVEEVNLLVGEEYSVISEYIDCYTKVKMRHNKCKHEYDVIPSQFTSSGNRCPKCKESRGEKRVSNFLDSFNVTYKSQFKINDCRNINPLPFDFSVFDRDNLYCLIEYDGKQHFEKPTGIFADSYEQTVYNDQIKNQYCADNSIKLIRIPYTEYDRIEEILYDELSEIIHNQQINSAYDLHIQI